MRASIFVLVGILSLLALSMVAYALEVDVVARLERVVDGDTIRVKVVAACDPRYSRLVGFEGRVRLADVNAPEVYTPEGLRARYALASLLAGVELVYIDVDDLYVYDRYGRIVGVVLAPFNKTHLIVVNEWLLEEGLAEPRDYPNEFHPGWPLYAPVTLLERCGASGETRTPVKTVTKTVTSVVWRIYTVTETAWAARTVTVTETVWRQAPPATKIIESTRTVTTTVYRVDERTALVIAAVAVALTAIGFLLGRLSTR